MSQCLQSSIISKMSHYPPHTAKLKQTNNKKIKLKQKKEIRKIDKFPYENYILIKCRMNKTYKYPGPIICINVCM